MNKPRLRRRALEIQVVGVGGNARKWARPYAAWKCIGTDLCELAQTLLLGGTLERGEQVSMTLSPPRRAKGRKR